jgi:hypothetical protein
MNTGQYHILKTNNRYQIEKNDKTASIHKESNVPNFRRSTKRIGFIEQMQGPHPERFQNINKQPSIMSKYKK